MTPRMSLSLINDRYEIEGELGRGGMSVVYIARDRQLMSKRVVVKVLLEHSEADEWVRKKFLQEMEALARIDHPNIVTVLDSGTLDDGRRFLVMQYVEGVTLREALAAGPMPLARVSRLVRQIGQGLSAAHDKGVWHRDLKPENILLQRLVDGEEQVRLIDFGIAGIHDSAFAGGGTKVAGTAGYMAPEQFAGQASAASDIYSMGVIAYEMLTGRRPHAPDSQMHLVSEKAARITPPRELRPELPVTAEKVLVQAISFRPELRQARARDFVEQLGEALQKPEEQATRTNVRTMSTSVGRAGAAKLEMANVLFTDIVGYSLLSMDQQRDYLAQLQDIVRAAAAVQKADAENEVLFLPTGDGMAIVFSGDPTVPVQAAVEIAAGLREQPHLRLRMGVHTGPVYRVADVNANANVAGGGINMAQRVMDAGDAGHILVSKTVADVLSQLSQWAPTLTSLGVHKAKHGVEVAIYNLVAGEAGNPNLPAKFAVAVPLAEAPRPAPAAPRNSGIMVAMAVAGLIAVGGGTYWARHQPAVPVIPSVAPGPALALNYSVTVQKYRNGAPYQEPFRVPGEMIFEKDYRIALEVTSLEAGFLYIVNEGIEGSSGKRTFNLLVPRDGVAAALPPSTRTRIPPGEEWFQFDAASGREMLYLFLSRATVPEFDRLRELAAGPGGVADPAEVSRISEWIGRHRSVPANIKKDGQLRQTEVRSSGPVLVHGIVLEHQ